MSGRSGTRIIAAAVAGAAAAALGFAFLLQLGFGIAPCDLCIWERWPYVAAILAAGGGVVLGRPRAGLALAAAAMLANVGLAVWHVGIEAGLFALPAGCAAVAPAASIEELRAQLATAAPRCDQVTAAWLGLSLAVWNGIYALALAVLALVGCLSGRSATPSRSARAW